MSRRYTGPGQYRRGGRSFDVVLRDIIAPSELDNLLWFWDVDDAPRVTVVSDRVTDLTDFQAAENLAEDASDGPDYNTTDTSFSSSSMTFTGANTMRSPVASTGAPCTFFGIFTFESLGGYLFGSGGANVFVRTESSPDRSFLAVNSGFTFGVEITAGWDLDVSRVYLMTVALNGTSTEIFINGVQCTVDASGFDAIGFSGISIGEDFGSDSDSTWTLSGVVTGVMNATNRNGLLEWAKQNRGVLPTEGAGLLTENGFQVITEDGDRLVLE